PLRFRLPATLRPGTYEIRMSVRFSTGETQDDSFAIHVLPRPNPSLLPPPPRGEGVSFRPSGRSAPRVALFDPRGETGRLLRAMRVPVRSVDAGADLAPYDLLIVGKGALTPDGPAPDIDRVRAGLKVVLFEQTAAALEKRF